MRPNITIVPVANCYARGFHSVLDAVARERTWLASLQAPPFETLEAFVQENVLQDRAQVFALDQGRVVGWADITGPSLPSLSHRGDLGMGVLLEYRGQGIGRALLAACIAKAQGKGMTRIGLEVRTDNPAAIALYEKLGFVTEARLRNALLVEGQYFDTQQMVLLSDVAPQPPSQAL